MVEPSPVEYLTDPLSDITRKERRNLLIASTIGVLVSKAGLIPSKLSTFGIEFSPPAQDTFVMIVAFTVLYFIGAFMIYGISDFLIWRKRYQDYLEGVEGKIESWSMEDQAAYDELHTRIPNIGWLYRVSKLAAFARIAFEYAVPLLYGLFVVVTLITKVLGS